jgi:hypothetical protein
VSGYIIAVNYYFLQRPEVNAYVHTDKEVGEWYDEIKPKCLVLSYAANACNATTHVWEIGELAVGCHTPFYALHIADTMGFDEIYLSGLDYNGELGAIHYYDSSGNWVHNAVVSQYLSYLEFKCHIAAKQSNYFALQEERYDKRFFARDKEHDVIKDFDTVEFKTPIYNMNPKSRLKKYAYKLPY